MSGTMVRDRDRSGCYENFLLVVLIWMMLLIDEDDEDDDDGLAWTLERKLQSKSKPVERITSTQVEN